MYASCTMKRHQKKSEPETREDILVHRDRYRVFIEQVADGFYEVDLKGNFRFFNEAFCRILGCHRGELLDHNYREFMDEHNARFAFESFNRMYRTGRGVTGILWEIIRKNGRARILEISANPIWNDFGEMTGFRGIAHDVTEKQHAQQASLKSEKLYRTLLDFVPDPLVVFNMEGKVNYLNPAFVKVFGWTLEELDDGFIPFVPDDLKEETRRGIRDIMKNRVVHGFETRRLTKDGRMLDINLNAAVFYEEDDKPAGQVLILRDVTLDKRTARSNQTLFRISMALPRLRLLNERLDFIIKEVQELIGVEGASVILLDEDGKEFYFPVAAYEDKETGKRMKEIRFPSNVGVAGRVLETGKPLIVPDTSKSPYFYQQVDVQSRYRTRSMLDVPIRTPDRMVGVLCAVNKKDGPFDQTDVELLSTIAGTVAPSIENARIHEELNRSYEEVKSYNRAKDRVIHHLAHELKTPISVLSASLNLLSKKLEGAKTEGLDRILERADRNLKRLLDIQYETEDILNERDYKTVQVLDAMVDACADELEALASLEAGEDAPLESIRRRVKEIFGPGETKPETDRSRAGSSKTVLQRIRGRFSHRTLSAGNASGTGLFHLDPHRTCWKKSSKA